MCGGVGLAMAVAIVIALLLRRGGRVAVIYGGVLGAVYGAWWITIGREGTEGPGHADAAAGDVMRFVATGIRATFGNLGQVTGVGLLLGVAFVGGAVLLGLGRSRATLRRVALPPRWPSGASCSSSGRGSAEPDSSGRATRQTSRYQHVAAALLLPALAVALDGLARVAGERACLSFVHFSSSESPGTSLRSPTARTISPGSRTRSATCSSRSRASVANEVPGAVTPFSAGLYERLITVEFLRAGLADGRLPDPGRITHMDRRAIRTSLALLQSHAKATPARCPLLTTPEHRRLAPGDIVEFRNGRLAVTPGASDVISAFLVGKAVFDAADGQRLITVLGPIDVELRGASLVFSPVQLCPPA